MVDNKETRYSSRHDSCTGTAAYEHIVDGSEKELCKESTMIRKVINTLRE